MHWLLKLQPRKHPNHNNVKWNERIERFGGFWETYDKQSFYWEKEKKTEIIRFGKYVINKTCSVSFAATAVHSSHSQSAHINGTTIPTTCRSIAKCIHGSGRSKSWGRASAERAKWFGFHNNHITTYSRMHTVVANAVSNDGCNAYPLSNSNEMNFSRNLTRRFYFIYSIQTVIYLLARNGAENASSSMSLSR